MYRLAGLILAATVLTAAPALADPLFERLAAGKLRIAGEEAA